jgi:transposase-like protein
MRCSKMRGKKGIPHRDSADPPRRRGNQVRGHGTWDQDRPPVVGVVGRESGQVRLQVLRRIGRPAREFVEESTQPDATVYTDEAPGYAKLPQTGRTHASVCHSPGRREWARDDDGDGIREVHDNTMEGLWTGVRNFLRPFRGVSKWFLNQYIAMAEWAHNLKAATTEFLQILLGMHLGTAEES